MTAPVLQLQGIGKSYRKYASQFRHFASWFGLSPGNLQEHWILRDITFALSSGEAIGIIGRNGAGKSTLLKIITGTLAATEGQLRVSGRVSAILELGMGFNSELTGRENALHSCGLMGHERSEIHAAMPGIEAFAEIGGYFDQPVRTYSSGMQVRLAFSVATAFRPEILIVDEALSVGDAYFQHKSFERIRQFQALGTTLLIVSHDRNAILSLCDRVILLEQGKMILDGNPEGVMDYYNAMIAEQEDAAICQSPGVDNRVRTVSGSGEITISEVSLLDARHRPVEEIDVGAMVSLRIRLHVHKAAPELVVGYMVRDRLGRSMYGTNSHHLRQGLVNLAAGQELVYDFTFAANLGPGSYSVTVAAHQGRSHLQKNYEWRDLALVFTVVNASRNEFVGCCWLEPTLSIEAGHG